MLLTCHWFYCELLFQGVLDFKGNVCSVVCRPSKEVIWCGICRLYADHTRILVGPTLFNFRSLLLTLKSKQICQSAFSTKRLHHRFMSIAFFGDARHVSPTPGFTVGWTMLNFVSSKGWSKMGSKTKLCMKELCLIPQWNHKKRNHQLPHDLQHWLEEPNELLQRRYDAFALKKNLSIIDN